MNQEFTRMIHGCGTEMEIVAIRLPCITVDGWRCPNHPDDEYIPDYVWDAIEYSSGTAFASVPYWTTSTAGVLA